MADKGKRGGVSISGISGGSIKIGGDVVGGDKITTGDVSGTAAIGRDASATGTQTTTGLDVKELLDRWKSEMAATIEKQTTLSVDDKADLKDHVAKIEAEAGKQADKVAAGEQAETGRLERLINTLAVMGPDIFDVAITTLANPLSGIKLVVKKIGDRARLEHQAASS